MDIEGFINSFEDDVRKEEEEQNTNEITTESLFNLDIDRQENENSKVVEIVTSEDEAPPQKETKKSKKKQKKMEKEKKEGIQSSLRNIIGLVTNRNQDDSEEEYNGYELNLDAEEEENDDNVIPSLKEGNTQYVNEDVKIQIDEERNKQVIETIQSKLGEEDIQKLQSIQSQQQPDTVVVKEIKVFQTIDESEDEDEDDDETPEVSDNESEAYGDIDMVSHLVSHDNESVVSKVKNMIIKPSSTKKTTKKQKPREKSVEIQHHHHINERIVPVNAKDLQMIPYPKKLGFIEVQDAIRKSFYTKQDYYSSSFDIIASYIKGQKVLYMEANHICVKRLNILMLPAIFLSAIACVLSLTINKIEWGAIIVAAVTAFDSCLLSLINYSKLEAASEAHKISSHQYDKLQSLCEFASGNLMVLPSNDKEDDIAREKMTIIEQKIKEIKEVNNYVIPKIVRRLFPTIYFTNVFSLVKKISNKETLYINEIKDCLNELRLLEYNMKQQLSIQEQVYPNGIVPYELFESNKDTMNRIIYKKKEIKQKTERLIRLGSEYIKIDNLFRTEIALSEKNRRWYWC